MTQLIKQKKFDDIDSIDDVKSFKDVFVLRLEDKLVALSKQNYEVVWETEIAGKTKINLDTIFIIQDTIITFSYGREEDVCFIHGVNVFGEVLWKSTSNYRPNGFNAVCKLNNNLVFNGYSVNQSSLEYRPILQINPITGLIKEIGQNRLGNTYIATVSNNLLVCGSNGIFNYKTDTNEAPKLISNDFLVNIILSNTNELVYLAQSGKSGVYNVVKIERSLEPKVIGHIELDSSDRGNMSPILFENKILSFEGKNKGVKLKDLLTNKTLWHVGNNQLKGISAIVLNKDNVLISNKHKNSERDISIYDLSTGDAKFKLDVKGITSKLYNIDNIIVIGSSRGLHIYEWHDTIATS